MTAPVTTPNPNPNPNTNIVTNAWEGIRGAPKWVYVTIVVGAIGIYFLFTKVKPLGVSSAGIEGKPGVDSTGIEAVALDGSSTLTDSNEVAYWLVEVAPAGWASTLNGIATQFHGNTNRVNEIQQANPDIKQKAYEKLPTGLKVKVPR